MPDSLPKEIERGWELLKEATEEPNQSLSKTKKALQLMIDFEKSEVIKPEDYLRCQDLKGYIYFLLGRPVKALKIFELAYQESMKVKKPLLTIDFMFFRLMCFIYLGSYDSSKHREGIETMENLLKSSLHEPYSEVEQREPKIYTMKAVYYYRGGNYDLAVEFYERSLEICNRYSHFLYHLKYVVSSLLGDLYRVKGELDQALQYQKQYIEFIKNSQLPGNKMHYADSLMIIGAIYIQQGDLDKAIDYFKKSLKILEQSNFPTRTQFPFANLIWIMVGKNSPELAKKYLDRFNQYNERLKNKEYNRWYKLSEAVILKASTRTRDKAEAEKILKKLLESHDKKPTGGFAVLSEEGVGFELCDIYLEKLRTTNNLAILGKIHPLIERLLGWTERTNSFVVQASTKLLQGQLALLEMNMGDARKYLSQAQQIAETHGLHLLARKVSYEHDKLLEQLDEWETLKKKKAPISERMDLVSLEETVDLILKKRGIKPPELVDEVPMLLLIITEGGIPAFSNPFSEELSYDDGFISNFLRGFNTFSEEVFSRGLNRATFGEYKLIMESIDSFSVCYLFKGQTYVAKQKLSRFAERVYNIAPVWQVFRDFHKTHQAILLSENPSLESLLEEIFIKKSAEISTQL